MKRIAIALLLALSTLAQAANFGGELAFNATGYTLTQTENVRGTDLSYLWFQAPDVAGRYQISVTSASDSRLISHTAMVADSEEDIEVDYAVGNNIVFTFDVGTDGDLRQGGIYTIWIHNLSPGGKYSCGGTEVCNVAVSVRHVR